MLPDPHLPSEPEHTTRTYSPWRFCVAPMMAWTDRHCRYFMRLLSRRARLYTEMVTADAVIHGNRQRLLGFDPTEQPLALQLGGCDPVRLAAAARIGEDIGYAEINLNVGCPSGRVQSARFGACLMAQPDLVADCVAAMRAAVRIPVTVKTRIGIDRRDSYQELAAFIERVAAGGCEVFIVHARKAWLQGLSPKENRELPPLDYPCVHRLKADFPHFTIVINGGLQTIDQATTQLAALDGVMLGRAAYHDPYQLAHVDHQLFADPQPALTRAEVVAHLLPYVERQLARGLRLNTMTRHILGLFQGQRGARAWRRYLSEHAHEADANSGVIRAALVRTAPQTKRPTLLQAAVGG